MTEPPVRVHTAPWRGEGDEGRPPSPWRVTGGRVIDMINDEGASVAVAAREADIHPRTLTRVLRKCGFVIARVVRPENFEHWLPGAKVHHMDELAALRVHLRADGVPVGPHWFAEILGIQASVMVQTSVDGRAVWEEMDLVDELTARGQLYTDHVERLPGEHGSRYGVSSDRPTNKTTRPKLPRPDRSKGGRPRRSTGADRHKAEVIAAYTLQGETIEQLARQYGMSRTTMYRRLVGWGVPMREPGRRSRGAFTGTVLRFPDEDEQP